MHTLDDGKMNQVPGTQALFQVGVLVDRLIADGVAVDRVEKAYRSNIQNVMQSVEALRIHSLEIARQHGIKSIYSYCVGSTTEIARVDESGVLEFELTMPKAEELFCGLATAITLGTPADNKGEAVIGLDKSLWLTIANAADRNDLAYVRLARSQFYVPDYFMHN